VIVTPEELAAIRRQAIEEYPSESCGVVLARGVERRLLRCRNIQDELHRLDPRRHPRDSRTAYHVHPDDWKTIDALDRQGFAVAVIYHSHIDAGAYFSETDRRMALLGQDPRTHEPLYPEAAYVVTSVVGGAGEPRVDAVAAFRWDGQARDFVAASMDAVAPAAGERIT
jgi:proteasome lid subunit RPN8/RPN11